MPPERDIDIQDPPPDTPQPGWRHAWRDFITSGGRADPDHPDYVRITVLNLVEGAAFFVWTLFLCLNLLGVFEGSTARLIIDATGIIVAIGVLASLRYGAPVAIVAEIVHGFLFVLLIGLAIARTDNPLAMTTPLIYPAVAFLLLDNVLRASLWTAAMIISLDATIIFGLSPEAADQTAILDGALTVSVAMVFQGAVMALYVHNRKHVMARLRTLSAELTYLAVHDELTGLYNRRTFLETVNRELGRRDRDTRLFAFLLFDIDHFKAFNDEYGHPRGDRLIKRIGTASREVFGRREDLVFRLGGEEFGVVYRAESQKEGTAMADRLLAAVEALGETSPGGPREMVTVSAGLVLSPLDTGLTAEEVYRRADTAMYRAKESGRGRWVLADRELD